VGRNLSVSWRRPLHAVRGWRQHLYDPWGRPWLDCIDNVAHVGHAHPRVVEAAARQKRVLETNTRYLHELLPLYAERLARTFPEPLSVCWLVSSGSEANELALRIARTATGREDVVVLEAAYHGNTTTLIDVSPYKHGQPGGRGAPPWVHVALLPDDFRGPYRREDPARGRRYASHVSDAVEAARARGGGPAAFLHESLLSCGGQIELPPGYLAEAYRAVRAAGGVVIADEVQVGLGRVGSHFWGFETQGVVPDIVTLGKPLGNGHPLGAVIATREVASAFEAGMEYFSTFGGNPASCAVGLAVLDVLEEEDLQRHAARVGARLLAGLRELARRHPAIGDVRGRGLFLGVELVRDRRTREPDAPVADYLVQRARERGILLSTDGPDHDVIKIKPPLPFDEADADRVVEVLDELLAEDFVQRRG
jgi:4-aminobutyrate aminotransferase-like enzyme